jgi:hypothetical protein
MTEPLQSYDLRTRQNTRYHLDQTGSGWQICWTDGASKTYPGLHQALFCLGGMVAWDTWSKRSRATLMLLNDGKQI